MARAAVEIGTGSSSVAAVEHMLRPKSVAVVGISSKPGSAGHTVLANLTTNDYRGDIHLVGRSGGTIAGLPVRKSIDDLPQEIEVAIFTLPAAGVREAMQGCVRRGVRSAIVFSSGFAEVGKRDAQDEIAEIARGAGIAMLGPNCLGYNNFVDGISAWFVGPMAMARITSDQGPAIAMISHSGGIMSHLRQSLNRRDLPVSYAIATGNEAGLGVAEFVDFFTHDKATGAIIVYVEQVRQPAAFLAAAARARAAGKPVLMLHPGRGERAKAAANSHTGALAGDYALMRTIVSHAGIVLLDTLDELLDTAEILTRFPTPPTRGPGVVTASGAFCAIAHDFCDDLGLEIPPLSPATTAMLTPVLPSFTPPHNPLDLTTQVVWQPELMDIGFKALLDDPAIGSLTISIPPPPVSQAAHYVDSLVAAMKGHDKPVVFSLLAETVPLAAEFVDRARQNRLIISRSVDRSLRAMAQVTFHGRALQRARSSVKALKLPGLPKLAAGTQPEWAGKKLLAAAGIRIPEGSLARTPDEAAQAASRIGYPVVMKAQAGTLAHKTEAGGVLLNIADEAALRSGWRTLIENVNRAQPGIELDGILVEKMAGKGLELMVGAKRDPQWGPVVLVGLGGIWVEALGDVRLLPPDLSEQAIVDELFKLRTAKLLRGFRGSAAADVVAVARTVMLVGRLIQTVPEIVEIDINPLVVHAQGKGVVALDALIAIN